MGDQVGAGEDSGGNPFFGVVTVTDPDSADFNGGTLTAFISAGGESTDRLALLAVGGVSLSGSNVLVSGVTVGTWVGGTGGTPLTVSFNASAQAAQVQAVYQSITYTTTSDTPTLGVRTISVVVTDGDGGTSNTGTGTVNLTTANNDQPVFSNLNGTPTYIEGGAAVVLDADVTIFDAELSAANNFNGATLTLTRNGGADAQDVFYSGAGTLSLFGGNVNVSGITIGTYVSGTGTLELTFNSNATQALVNSAMQQITYHNTSDAPPATVQVDWTFNDGNSGTQGSGGALTATGSTTVTIIATNDAPVITPVAPDVTFVEGGLAQVIDATGTITDMDSANFDGGVLTISISANGTADDRLMVGGLWHWPRAGWGLRQQRDLWGDRRWAP